MSIQRKPVNYLNNADLLREIHASKKSYCAYIDGQYDFDAIIQAVDVPYAEWQNLITPEVITLACEAKAKRLKVPVTDISPDDLVYRVMTWDHIPMVPKPVKKSSKTAAQTHFTDEDDTIELAEVAKEQRARVNFPPFQQVIVTPNCLEVVAYSHRKGGMMGEFCADHGSISKELAKMMIMLCERYAMKYNFRGYTYNDELRGSAILQLTYVGLRFNEAKSSNPFAFFTTIVTNAFKRILTLEKKVQTIRDDLMEMSGQNPSWSRTNVFSNE